ncbi:alanine racemase [Alteraurantiacibacter palmitatis]|uniref:alanine racemase n=1 Tax=Alteraurantiacibacter palmitatis TaxID=2054628 RepID=A0ABV7E4Y5_9SPHN
MDTAPPPATLRLRIDRQALAANWRALDRLSGQARAGAAVKADCYGVGIIHALPALLDAGARDFFVAHWSEVADVLAHVPGAQISVLHGVTNAAEAAYARATGVRPVINSLQQAAIWRDAGGGLCDLMVDTGINRLGVSLAELGDPLVMQLAVHTLLSHLASADEDSALNAVQLERTRQAAAVVAHQRLSLANSAGIALGADYAFDLTRPGLALYGGIARGELAGHIRQVVFPQAMVIQRRRIGAGESVGYNATFTAADAMETATVSIGYADGFLRCRGTGAALQHCGHNLPVRGRVSMDMVVVDCTAHTALSVGDFVDIPFDLPNVAQSCGLSQYELLTSLGRRFSRIS